jgi:hypothetical protein
MSMAMTEPDSKPLTEEHLAAIRVHLRQIRRWLGILVWLAAAGLLLALVLALNTVG